MSPPAVVTSKNRRPSKVGALFAIGLLGLTAIEPSHGATKYWNGTATDWTNFVATGTLAWSSVPTATSPNTALPVAADDVVFSIDSVNTVQNIRLVGNNKSVNSMRFAGSNTAATNFSSTGASYSITVGAGGITVDAGAGAVTIGATTPNTTAVLLGADQTWANNSSNRLTITQPVVVGPAGAVTDRVLTFSGTGSGDIYFNSGLILSNSSTTAGYIKQTSGNVTVNTFAGNGNLFAVGNLGYGFYDLSGGTLSVTGTNQFRVGNTGNQASFGVMYISNGVLTTSGSSTSPLSIGNSTSSDAGLVSQGVMYVTGGTVTSNTGIAIAKTSGYSALTIDGSAYVNANGSTSIGFNSAFAIKANGYLNLNGGTLQTSTISTVTGTGAVSYVNFNGGTVRASADSSTFLEGHDGAYIYQDGATIDTNGHAIAIAQDLLAPTGNGVTSITVSGTGYEGAPAVRITGDGTGATAVANVDSSGNLTGITITSAGVGYTNASVIITGGGGATTVSPVASFGANTSGGLTKSGLGVLTLTGSNTYTGLTNVTAGTLIVGVSGTGSLASAVTVASGATLGGSGVINGAVTVSGTLAPGNSPGTLTINNSLTLSDGANVLMELAGTGAGQFDSINVTGALTLDGIIKVSLISGFDPAYGNSFTLFSGWSGSIVDNGFTFDFSDAVLSGGMTWDTSNFLTTGAISAVPEPSTWALLGLGLVAMGWRLRRTRQS